MNSPTSERRPTNVRRLTPWRLARLESAFESFGEAGDVLRLCRFWTYSGHSAAKENTLRCLGKAETLARTSCDWGLVAIEYAEFFLQWEQHHRRDAIRCMRRAEAVALTSGDWLDCACSWTCLSDIAGDRQAVRCLRTAVDMATTSIAFSNIAIYCVQLFLHHDGAEAMLREAEHRAVTKDDWEVIRLVYECGFYEDGRRALAEESPTLHFTLVGGRIA